MRHIPLLTIAVAALLVPAARAQDAADGGPDRTERRQRVLAAFDEDGDGELNDAEREKAREELGGGPGASPGNRSDRPRGPRDERGPRPDGPPDPGRMFDRFDENNDDQLSREEFTKLTAALREMRERWGGGPPRDYDSAERDDRPGTPEDGGDRPRRRRDFGDGEGFRPLENPGPPPRREEEQGYRGPGGDRGARDGGGEGRGPHHMGPPNPERLFSAFDANDDGQLSRDEFMQLTGAVRERMADMRGRGFGPPGPREDGPPRFRRSDGPDGPPRPPRPPRPDFESADPPDPQAADNSA